MPLPELKKLDAGGWFDKKFENERIPTLDEALDLLSGKRCIQIEIKLASAEVDHVEITRRVVEAVQERNLLGSVILSSFEPRVLKKARQLEPKLKIAAQYNRDLQDELSLKDLLQQTGADLVYVNHKLATRKLIDVAKEAEKPLLVYTVNDKTTAKSLKQRGITGFVTDDPEIFEPKKRASGTIEP